MLENEKLSDNKYLKKNDLLNKSEIKETSHKDFIL